MSVKESIKVLLKVKALGGILRESCAVSEPRWERVETGEAILKGRMCRSEECEPHSSIKSKAWEQ